MGPCELGDKRISFNYHIQRFETLMIREPQRSPALLEHSPRVPFENRKSRNVHNQAFEKAQNGTEHDRRLSRSIVGGAAESISSYTSL